MEKYYPKKIEKKWPSSAKATEGKLKKYEPLSIEKKWQQIWERENLYKAEDFSERPKFYCLDMFPYPSGEGLHVGHWRGYVLSDVISRYQMLKGKNVVLFFSEGLMCYPACWDQIAAFGKDNEFASKDTIALTILNDPKSDWKMAIEKMPELAKAVVLFDTDKRISITYDMLSLPSSMHKGQLPGHTYVVIDKEGIVRYVKDDVSMAVRNQELIAEINKL